MHTKIRKPLSYNVLRQDFGSTVALKVLFEDEQEVAVAAYQDGIFPSVIVTLDSFLEDTKENQRMDMYKVSFEQFRGYKIWCCEMVGNEMRVCLSKD